ncbi:unnamed protein product [Symbiodinium sp. CCMP2592]|nr:unnamed protein product [Symbiodinium sp. CCMP2592]
MDKDQKLIAFLDCLGPDADVDSAQQLLESHSWDLQAALETVTGRGQTAVSAEVPLQTDEARPPMRTGFVDRLIHSPEEDDEAIAMAQSAVDAADEASARLERVLLESQQAFDQQAEIQEQAALAQALEASDAAVSRSQRRMSSRAENEDSSLASRGPVQGAAGRALRSEKASPEASEDDEAIAMAQSAVDAADEASARLERVLLESQQAFDQQAEIQEQAALAQALEASDAAVSRSQRRMSSRAENEDSSLASRGPVQGAAGRALRSEKASPEASEAATAQHAPGPAAAPVTSASSATAASKKVLPEQLQQAAQELAKSFSQQDLRAEKESGHVATKATEEALEETLLEAMKEVARHPEKAEAHQKLARVEEAIRHKTTNSTDFPRSSSEQKLRADKDSGKAGSSSEAAEKVPDAKQQAELHHALEKVVSNPDNSLAQLQLGAAFIRVQDFEGAAEAFERASLLEPNDPTAHYALGQTKHKLGKLREAEASLEKAISLKADEGCKAALAAVRKDPRPEPALSPEQDPYDDDDPEDEDYADDFEDFQDSDEEESVAGENEDEGLSQESAGEAKAKKEKALEEALQAVKAATTELKEVERAALHRKLGKARRDLKDWAGAQEAFLGAVRLDPGDADLFKLLGQTQRELGKGDEAEASLCEARRLQPKNSRRHADLGDFYRDYKKSLEAAEKCFEEAFRLKSSNVEYRAKLAKLRQDLGKRGDLPREAQEKASPAKTGKEAGATEVDSSAKEADSDAKAAKQAAKAFHVGQNHKKNERHRKAEHWFSEAVRLQPTSAKYQVGLHG